MYAIGEDDSENVEEPVDNEQDLQAWCVLEESETEQWQQTKGEESQSSVAVGCGEPSQFELKENQGQVGESQSHHGLWSCGPCDD